MNSTDKAMSDESQAVARLRADLAIVDTGDMRGEVGQHVDDIRTALSALNGMLCWPIQPGSINYRHSWRIHPTSARALPSAPSGLMALCSSTLRIFALRSTHYP
jgi:hypothetical protein